MLRVSREMGETKAVQWTGWNLMEVLTFIGAQLDSPETHWEYEGFNKLQESYRNGIYDLKVNNYVVTIGFWIVIIDDGPVVLSDNDFKKSYETL